MRYKINTTQLMPDVKIDEDSYSTEIHLDLEHETGMISSKILTVTHNNKQNGYEVDEQREKEIQEFLNSINK